MMIETDFSGEHNREALIKGHFFLIPDPATLEIFVSLVGARHE
jgi:hypothetical protein